MNLTEFDTAPPAPRPADQGKPALTPMCRAALEHAARGWHVFPMVPGGKRAALHGYDRCPRTGPCAGGHLGWEQRATTDPDRIRGAWVRRPGRKPFNVGIACGPSGLVVIDLDVTKPGDDPPPDWVRATPGIRDGQDVLADLAERAGHPQPVDTYTVATPSGGLHLYYRTPAGTQLRNTSGERGRGLGWKIDTRAHGGCVAAAGSYISPAPNPDPTGYRGTYPVYRAIIDREPAPLPDWLAERLAPTPPPPTGPITLNHHNGHSRYLAAALQGEAVKVREAPGGQRNAILYAAAVALGQLVAGGGLTEEHARTTLLEAAAVHIACRAYSEHQALNTIASGIRAGGNRPRQVVA